MKKLLLIAATAVLAASPAMANPAGVGGTAPTSCSITGLPSTVSFTDLDLYGNATPVQFTGIDVLCNETSTIELTSANGYLRNDTMDSSYWAVDESIGVNDLTSAGATGFNAGVNYTYSFVGGPVKFFTSFMTAGVPVVATGVAPLNFSGLTLEFATEPDTMAPKPLLGGTHSDVLTVSITPTGI